MNTRYSVVLLAGLMSTVSAGPQVFFSPGGVQKQLVSAIDHTTRTLDVAVFELSAKPLMEALKRAGQRGVRVRMILDGKVLRERGKGLELARVPHISLRTLSGREPRRGIMHNKFAIFDETRIVTGSYNWSHGAEIANYENVIFEDDGDVVRAYSGQFADLWVRAKPVALGHLSPKTYHKKYSSH